MSTFSTGLDYPLYTVEFITTATGDAAFCIVNPNTSGFDSPVSANGVLSGDLSEGSFEEGLLLVIKSYIEGLPGGIDVNVSLLTETRTGATPE